jgi:hypothetical protein
MTTALGLTRWLESTLQPVATAFIISRQALLVLYPNGAPERAVSTTAWHSSGAPGNPTAQAPTRGGVAPCAVFLRVLAPTQMRTARVLPQGGRPQSYLRRRHTQHCSWEEETRWDTEVHTHEMSNLLHRCFHTRCLVANTLLLGAQARLIRQGKA